MRPSEPPTSTPVASAADVAAVAVATADVSGRAARGGMLVMASQVLRVLVQIGSTALLARLLAPADFGLVAMAGTLTMLFTMFADLGLTQATVQKADITPAQISTLFWVNAAFGALFTLLCVLLAPLIAWFYGHPDLVPITAALALGFLITGLYAQHGALLNRRLRFKAVAIIAGASALISAGTAVVLALLGAGIWALVAQQLTYALVTLVGNVIAVPWRPGRPRLAEGSGDLLRFGGNLSLTNLLIYVLTTLDRILIGWWVGERALGLYDRAGSLTALPNRLIIFPLGNVVIPALSRLQHDPAAYRRFYLEALEKLGMATLPPLLLLALLAPEAVAVLFGPGWEEAAPLLAFLAVGTLARPVGTTAGWLFISQGRTREQLIATCFTAAFGVLAFVTGLPYGAVGVAAATAVLGFALLPFVFWLVTREGPVALGSIPGALLPGTLGALAAAAAVVPLRLSGQLPDSPLLTGLILGTAGMLATLAVYAVLPSGRKALGQARGMIGGRRVAAPVPGTAR